MSENLIHSLDGGSHGPRSTKSLLIIVLAGAILVGAGSGYLLSTLKKAADSNAKIAALKGKKIGIADKKTFKDQAEGYLKEGGMEGEGSFHLQRPGGISQNVYLTSSTVDLSEYVDRKVKVWGETFKGEKAGWLMDVGLVEILQ